MNLVIIDNFLTEDFCNKLIENFKKYKNKHRKFNNRYLIKLNEYKEDVLFKEAINKYFKQDKKIKNIEILSWEIGESHPLHNDAKFYDYTTITYLNENYVGGRTIVNNIEIEPKIGKYIGFDSKEMHMVTELISGERYVLICWY
jgi:hypothetical protein